jgi:hypothetical protein
MRPPGPQLLARKVASWLRELLPASVPGALLTVAAASFGTMLWVTGAQLHPEESLDIIAMFRYRGDAEYYPLTKALADLQFGEAITLEERGQGLRPFPVFSVLLHAAALRALGPAGLALADMVVLAAFFLLVRILLRRIGVATSLAELLALSASFGVHQGLRTGSPLGLRLLLWGMRYPRPFVTQLFCVACLAAILALVYGRTRARSAALAAGIALSLLFQTDIHTGFGLLFALPPVAIVLWLARPGARRDLLRAALWFCVSFTATLLPFLVQRAWTHPDAAVRFGLFPVPRWPPLWEAFALPQLLLVVFVLPVPLALWLWLGRPGGDWRARILVVVASLLVSVAAYFALPISCLLLGQSIEPYHFQRSFHAASAFQALIVVAYVLDGAVTLATRLSPTLARPAFRRLASAVVVLLALYLAGVASPRFHAAHDKRDHVREDVSPEYRGLPDYRTHFAALAEELRRPAYADCRVIATFDLMVYNWWLTFRDGAAFTPGVFDTTFSDAEIERRLVTMARLLGMDADDFLAFVKRRYVMIFWLGQNKYQASRAYTHSPFADYAPEDQTMILRHGVYASWSLALSLTDQRRLRSLFETGGIPARQMPRLDLIVLTNDESLGHVAPPAADFERTYADDVFRVFRRRGRN